MLNTCSLVRHCRQSKTAVHPHCDMACNDGVTRNGVVTIQVCIVSNVRVGLDVAAGADMGCLSNGRPMHGNELPYRCASANEHTPRLIRPFVDLATVLRMRANNAVRADEHVILDRDVRPDDGRGMDDGLHR